MRTTVTLDDDVAAKLQRESRRSGVPFKDVLNSAVRRGLMQPVAHELREPFRLRARDVGEVRPGVQLKGPKWQDPT